MSDVKSGRGGISYAIFAALLFRATTPPAQGPRRIRPGRLDGPRHKRIRTRACQVCIRGKLPIDIDPHLARRRGRRNVKLKLHRLRLRGTLQK